ncbi:MAG TPA: hypothetical protein DCL38_07580 [Lachnospiraceae bacterium]|nr:hypothetical protein [Lachnospiraceae bacterium]
MLLAQTSRIDSVAQFVTVLLAFVFVLVITLLGTRLIGNYQKKQSFSGSFESIEGFRIANNKYLQLVRIGKRYFVLAVGKEEVSVVTEISEGELELSDKNGELPGSFGRILGRSRESSRETSIPKALRADAVGSPAENSGERLNDEGIGSDGKM